MKEIKLRVFRKNQMYPPKSIERLLEIAHVEKFKSGIEEIVWMESLGCFDSDNKEIFDGDILEIKNSTAYRQKQTLVCILKFDFGTWYVCVQKVSEWELYSVSKPKRGTMIPLMNILHNRFIKIIGDEYTTPELLTYGKLN